MFAGLTRFPRSAVAAVGAAIAACCLLAAGCGSAAAPAGNSPGVNSRGGNQPAGSQPASSHSASGHSGSSESASTSVPKVIVVRDNANGTTVSMRPGDSLELILSSTYWKVAGSSASRVLQQQGATVLLPRPTTCPSIPGLGCTPQQTSFKALAQGTAVITASRLTCGEALACQGAARLFKVTVVVSS
jgi:hypothetical protein